MFWAFLPFVVVAVGYCAGYVFPLRTTTDRFRKSLRWQFHTDDGKLVWWRYEYGNFAPTVHRWKISPGLWPDDHNCDRCQNTGTRDYDGVCDDCAGSSTYAARYEVDWYRTHRFGRWLWIVRNWRGFEWSWWNERRKVRL